MAVESRSEDDSMIARLRREVRELTRERDSYREATTNLQRELSSVNQSPPVDTTDDVQMMDETTIPSLLQRLETPTLASRISSASAVPPPLQDRLSDPTGPAITAPSHNHAAPANAYEAERPTTPTANAGQQAQDDYTRSRAAWIARGKRPQGRPTPTTITHDQRAMFDAARAHVAQLTNAINDNNFVVPLRPHGLPPLPVHPRFPQWYEDELAWIIAANMTWHDHREIARTTVSTRGDPFVIDALGEPPAPFVHRSKYKPYIWGGPSIADLPYSTLVSVSKGGGHATRNTTTRARTTTYATTPPRQPPTFYKRGSIDPPSPHDYANNLNDLRRLPEDTDEITTIEQLRIPANTEEVRLVAANAQRPGNTVALRMFSYLLDIANHPRDATLSLELREFLLAIRWKRPQWAKDREFKEFDACTKDKYRRGYVAPQLRVGTNRSPMRAPSPVATSSTAVAAPPQPTLDPRQVADWETWLRDNEDASFPGIERTQDGRVANRDALRGMLLIADRGPSDQSGRESFMRFSAIIQRSTGAISSVRFTNTTARWTASTPVNLDTVKWYWASVVSTPGYGAHILSDQNCIRKWLLAIGRDHAPAL